VKPRSDWRVKNIANKKVRTERKKKKSNFENSACLNQDSEKGAIYVKFEHEFVMDYGISNTVKQK
jgi:hypothetical protein